MSFKFICLNLTLILSLMLLSSHHGKGQTNPNRLSVDDYEKMISSTPGAQLIDVRSSDEYAKGHLKNALNYDFNNKDFENQISKLDKNKPCFIYCTVGVMRTVQSANQMRKEGFSQVYEMDGGLMKWNEAKKPIEKSSSPDAVVVISDSAFQKIIKDNPVVIADFYESWCGMCKMQAVIMDSLKDEQKGKVYVLKVLVDKNKDLAGKMQVSSYPTLVLFKNGKQVWRSEGIMPKAIIADAIKNK